MRKYTKNAIGYISGGIMPLLVLLSAALAWAEPQEPQNQGETTDPTVEADTDESPADADAVGTAPHSEAIPAPASTDTAAVQAAPTALTAPSKDTAAKEPTSEENADSFFGAFGIRRLPPSSYPGPRLAEVRDGSFVSCFASWEYLNDCARIRGISGGSLAMTFHGMQWPYIPGTGIGVSGDVWVDLSYENINIGVANSSDIHLYRNQARGVLRATPTYTKDDWFIQGQAEVVVNGEQVEVEGSVVETDDLWVRAGMWDKKYHNWDIQVGRFQAWEIYHFGMGLDLNTSERNGAYDGTNRPVEIYGVTWAWDRPSGVANVAFHYYPLNILRFEGLVQYGNIGSNIISGRGAMVIDLGWVKLKGGGEYKKETPRAEGAPGSQDLRGAGGSIDFVLYPWVELGMNGAWAMVDKINTSGELDKPGTYTKYSYGPFINIRVVEDLLVGGGTQYSKQWDVHENATYENRVGKFDHFQTFGAIQYRLFKELYIKQVVAYSNARFAPSFERHYSNDKFSVRLRLAYYF